MIRSALSLLLLTSSLTFARETDDNQYVLKFSVPVPEAHAHHEPNHHVPSHGHAYENIHHPPPPEVMEALRLFPTDPVNALKYARPDAAEALDAPRLLRVLGEDEPRWMTEGDKLRLRRGGRRFVDLTGHDFEFEGLVKGEANLPELTHQRLVKPLFARVSTDRMRTVLEHMTGYYNRLYNDVHGEMSAEWLHGEVARIIKISPFGSHISLEYFTHAFRQPSIIARFEPPVRNFSLPLTILGAHQDSANYLFPLLPAPGADDDCSGTVSILEAFRVLAEAGFRPKDGPVEFHWYAAEEAGLLGSLAIAQYKRASGQRIGAMLEFDMTAYVARNATESIAMVSTQADEALTNWTVALGKEYLSVPIDVYELGPNAGSDYMSYTMYKYPSAFATEGDPMNGGFPGDMDPYVHTAMDRMDVDDDRGYFSLDHMARFTELAIAYTVEQAGWDNRWR
ncbi:Zn-dependent exopeptidase [Cladorrhinum sp. PSN259]|nr:Zn-dependent exopeptidase [Cladorrhinum sp. PSN259]